jgi:hypothetical protein
MGMDADFTAAKAIGPLPLVFNTLRIALPRIAPSPTCEGASFATGPGWIGDEKDRNFSPEIAFLSTETLETA